MNQETNAVWRNLDVPFFRDVAQTLLDHTDATDVLTPRETATHKLVIRLEAEVWDEAGTLGPMAKALMLVAVNLVDFEWIALRLLE